MRSIVYRYAIWVRTSGSSEGRGGVVITCRLEMVVAGEVFLVDHTSCWSWRNFVDGKKNLSKSLVGAVVLIEECGGGVESIAKLGELGASGVGWDDGYRAGADGHNKRGDG